MSVIFGHVTSIMVVIVSMNILVYAGDNCVSEHYNEAVLN